MKPQNKKYFRNTIYQFFYFSNNDMLYVVI